MSPLYLLIAFGVVGVIALWICSLCWANDEGFCRGFELGQRLVHPPEESPR